MTQCGNMTVAYQHLGRPYCLHLDCKIWTQRQDVHPTSDNFHNAIWCHIPADSILHSDHQQTYKSPITLHHRSPTFLCKRATPTCGLVHESYIEK